MTAPRPDETPRNPTPRRGRNVFRLSLVRRGEKSPPTWELSEAQVRALLRAAEAMHRNRAQGATGGVIARLRAALRFAEIQP